MEDGKITFSQVVMLSRSCQRYSSEFSNDLISRFLMKLP